MVGIDLSGKVALVTGAARGIGASTAELLAEAGASVVLGDVLGDALHATAARIAAKGHRAKAVLQDVTDEAGWESVIEDTVREFGGLDVLVNNAGIQHTARIEEFPAAKWNAILAINLSSAFFTAQSALPAMRARGWGRIVNVASVHGLVASPMKSAYVAAKHGLVGLTKVIALETAGSGITANAICPGWVLTPLVEKQIEALAAEKGISLEDASLSLLAAKQPSKTFVTPEELGELAVFLCSDAARSITGVSVPVDGGWTAQ